ncbi:MAG: fused MFS/spermidine synthase [Candidatus Omnitrophica bacterium]|nr:fused MFS/spermidine synthase [Candidatus Omnitrophota bacterium]
MFQIELIIARMFLPYYGGSYLVWGACVVFFQATLLAGYVFAHGVISRWGMRKYRLAHLLLLLAPLFFFPGRALSLETSFSSLPLALDVFVRLLITIGMVFFVLSTVSIVSQTWLSASGLSGETSPYELYGVSNLGSFAALLSYPFIFEAHWDLPRQLLFWRALYFFCVGLNIWALIRVKISAGEGDAAGRPSADGVKFSQAASWLVLGAAGVTVFLSVNNIITSEIIPVPLLWIIPLSLYLLSFVLNFRRRPWCPPWVVSRVHLLLGCAALLFFLIEQRFLPVMIALLLLCAVQFLLCLYCQNRLIAQKPRDDRHLTLFYVIFSSGGFAGGLLTTWVVPLVSYSPVEYLIGLLAISLAIILEEKKFYFTAYHFLWVTVLAFGVVAWPVFFTQYSVWGLLLIFMLFRLVFHFKLKQSPAAVALALACMVAVAYCPAVKWAGGGRAVYTKRNYYGISEVVDSAGARALYHGETLHGAQYLAENKKGEALAYYNAQSPAAKILLADDLSSRRIALVGLGPGALAAYGRPDQTLDFYELDPDMYFIAGRYFTYLRDSPAKINFIFGDARRSLEKAPAARYDLMVVDAFGGDSIPFHLLTREAISLYRERLNSRGVILFHVSNRYLDLKDVLARAGASLDAHVAYAVSEQEPVFNTVSTWVVMTWDDASFQALRARPRWVDPDARAVAGIRLWTDQYINIFPMIKWGRILNTIRDFRPLKG